MSEYPKRENKPYPKRFEKSDPGRWSSADPDSVTKLAQHHIDADVAEINDFFWSMRRQYPGIFQGWSLTQFKNWNDERILALAEKPPIETTEQARARIQRNCQG